uniref:N-acetylglucosamine/diacetylchitobiose ABC transporter substrate-binding protein n=1 Tax=Nonomuraea bangladeshensis TaxID=404385 RepID=UPI003F49855A
MTIDHEGIGRRSFLVGSALSFLAAGCATSGGGTSPRASSSLAPTSTANPLGVEPAAPLEFYNFDGGFGKEWTKLPLDLYRKAYPGAQVKLTSGQELQKQLAPRFVQGDVPDLIENVGLDTAALVRQNQVLTLEDLLAAPSFDVPGKTVEQTLLPGAGKTGFFDGKKYAQPYSYGMSGIWFSKTLFEKHGWTYPKTWEEMLALCSEIQKAGLAPWTYQGQYPGYLVNPILATATKAGGGAVGAAVDNLEPNAWTHPALVEAASRYHEIAAKGYLLKGTTGLSHTQAQTYWAEGKAVFIPCGSWLENELGELLPADFGMSVAPEPSLSAGDALPFETIMGGPAGELIVPAKAKNPQGGKELLRILLSQQNARAFSKLTNSLTVVAGAADGLELSHALGSMRDVINAAGQNVYPNWMLGSWYPKLLREVENATAAMMSKEIDGKAWATRIQKAADAVAKDNKIKKYKR